MKHLRGIIQRTPESRPDCQEAWQRVKGSIAHASRLASCIKLSICQNTPGASAAKRTDQILPEGAVALSTCGDGGSIAPFHDERASHQIAAHCTGQNQKHIKPTVDLVRLEGTLPARAVLAGAGQLQLQKGTREVMLHTWSLFQSFHLLYVQLNTGDKGRSP